MAQFIRFCVAATASFLTGLAALAALVECAHLNYQLSYVMAFLASNLTGYLLNAWWTFGPNPRRGATAVLRFMTVNLVLLAINSALLRLMVERIHFHYLVASALLALLNAPVGFLLHRAVSYRAGSFRLPRQRIEKPGIE